jgi:hypothetical protein
MGVVVNKKYNVVVNSEELIGATECLMLHMRCHINQSRYNQV